MSDRFTCEACGRTFNKEWSDEAAQAKLNAEFPGLTTASSVIVCEPCFAIYGPKSMRLHSALTTAVQSLRSNPDMPDGEAANAFAEELDRLGFSVTEDEDDLQ